MQNPSFLKTLLLKTLLFKNENWLKTNSLIYSAIRPNLPIL